MERVPSGEQNAANTHLPGGTNATATNSFTGSNSQPKASTRGSTNENHQPFSHTLNGNAQSFSPSTDIYHSQCQNINHQPHSNVYYGCTFHNATGPPASPAPSTPQQVDVSRSGQSAPDSSSTQAVRMGTDPRPRAEWNPWPWALLISLVRVIFGTNVTPGGQIRTIVLRGPSAGGTIDIEHDIEAQLEGSSDDVVYAERVLVSSHRDMIWVVLRNLAILKVRSEIGDWVARSPVDTIWVKQWENGAPGYGVTTTPLLERKPAQ
ncbi:hypothetical protein PQX77_006260 [Marasmius sp. AFHP31]|nr:hypothetical protein PQX77_006260 [Marasmius sp. AFHP31]